MKIRMNVYISGTRCGEEWPPPGTVIDLPDAEARDYMAAGMATPVATFKDAERAVVKEESVEERVHKPLTKQSVPTVKETSAET